MPRVPRDATVDTQRSFRELWQAIDRMERANITDLHGRRLTNAGHPKQRRDYANKGYIDDLVERFRKEVKQDIKKVSRLRVEEGGGGAPPPTTASLDFGYFKLLHASYGNFISEVTGYTNLTYYDLSDAGPSETPPSERLELFKAGLVLLTQPGFKLILDASFGYYPEISVEEVIAAAAPVWDSVKYVVLADELNPSVVDIEEVISNVKAAISEQALSPRPIGAIFTPKTILEKDVGQYSLDFVGLEAYTTPCAPPGCGTGGVEAEVAKVVTLVNQMKDLIPATKDLLMVMQAYDRNGAFQDITALAAINAATYFTLTKGDARVKALAMFAYGYPGGTRNHPELKTEHQKIWADLTGGGGSGSGPKKCSGDPRACPGLPVCCDGGDSNPCCCPRLCESGAYMAAIGQATQQTIVAHQELFVPGTQQFLGFAEATQFRGYVTVYMNTNNPALESIDDPNDAKQVLTRLRLNPEFREDYAVWSTDLTPRLPPGSYRATCWPGTFGPVDC